MPREKERVADIHIHSYLSRATSKQCDLMHLSLWAQRKGIALLGTSDFTHPEWFDRISTELEPVGDTGLFRLRADLADAVAPEVPRACRAEVRFLLEVEISSIYKRGGQVRKVHNLVFFPDLDAVRRFRAALARIGNIESDGRPILGLDSRDLLEIVLECSDRGRLIPAHVWTPWFSVFGSKSGFDALAECYGDLTSHIFALETGLSSDPPMNWRLSQLDGLTLVSNSDAHSPAKLGREANLFRTELAYDALFDALASGDPERFGGTLEFFPEEGKYHLDGCRKCGQRLTPAETRALGGRCPGCGKKITVGVMSRVDDLADRPPGARPDTALPFESLIPLQELLGECIGQGPATKRVVRTYERILGELGPELDVLRSLPTDELERGGVPLVAEAIRRMRAGEVHLQAGYDGEFGVVRAFAPDERTRLLGQGALFAMPAPAPTPAPTRAPTRAPDSKSAPAVDPEPARESAPAVDPEPARESAPAVDPEPARESAPTPPVGQIGFFDPAPAAQASAPADPLLQGLTFGLTAEQRAAVQSDARVQLIVAGPGSGKTRTLTRRLAWLLREPDLAPASILAVTFTHRAAGELRERIAALVSPRAARDMTVTTFHGLGLALLRRHAEVVGLAPDFPVLDERAAVQAVALELGTPPDAALRRALRDLTNLQTRCPDPREGWTDAERALGEAYERARKRRGALDFADLIGRAEALLADHPDLAEAERRRYRCVAVDEVQDIDPRQRRLLSHLVARDTWLSAIGDPDQSIYGFRGADVRLFARFAEEHPGLEPARLSRCFRSLPTILAAAEAVVAPAPDYGRVRMVSANDAAAPPPVTLNLCATPGAEAVEVTAAIERLLGDIRSLSAAGQDAATQDAAPLGFGDVAVLSRTNARLDPVAEALARAGIPTERSRDAAAAADAADEAALLGLLRLRAGRATPGDLLALLGRAGLSRRALVPLMPRLPEAHDPEGLAAAFEATGRSKARAAAAQTLAVWCDAVDPDAPAPALLEAAAGALELAWPPAPGAPLCAHLWTLAGQGADLDLGALLDRRATEQPSDRLRRAERVSLLTLHAAKGLEFEAVFVVGCEDGTLPGRRAIEAGESGALDALHEERRLLYVGMTRARRHLWLGAAKTQRRHGETLTPALSRFLADLPEGLLERVDHTQKRRRARQRQLDLV